MSNSTEHIPRSGALPDETPENDTPLSLDALCLFLSDFIRAFICAGGQTVRVVRSAQRIGLAFGMEVEMMLLSRHAVMTVTSLTNSSVYRTRVVSFDHIGVNFTLTFALNRLSWEFFDAWIDSVGAPVPGRGLSRHGLIQVMGHSVPRKALDARTPLQSQDDLNRLRGRFTDIIHRPRLRNSVLCPLIGIAGAAFCRLFGGDAAAMGMVFFASQAGFLIRHLLVARLHMDVRLGFLAAAFTASFLTAVSSRHIPSATPEIAVAASVLFLIPGIPLLSAINDILNGYTLMGISRGANAAILTLCIAFGLAATLMITGFNVL